MTTLRLAERYLVEYARRPMNVALLILVPLIFVALAASAIADFAEIVGGISDPRLLAAPTAGWAAAFIAGIAGFFHVVGSREADRRLSLAGLGSARVIVARIASGIALAAAASAAALSALAMRTGVEAPIRTAAGTLMFALTYLGIGVAVGILTKNEVNGSLAVIFVWMLDVFLGPAMAGGTVWITRLFPSHYVTLVILNSSSGHAGPLGDLGWAVAWTLGSLIVAAIIFGASAGIRGRAVSRYPPSKSFSRLYGGLRAGFRDYRRNLALWVLLIFLPVFFITLSFYITPDQPTPVELVENGVTQLQVVSMIDVHGAIMVPITVAFLAGLAGLFVVEGAIDADARLALAGFRPREIFGARLGIIGVAAFVTTGVAIAVTAVDFTPQSWFWFAAANLLLAATYGLIGVIVGVAFGKLGGVYVMFLLPFVDIGIAQNLMFSAAPPQWGAVLPGRGAVRVLVDAAFTPGFDQVSGVVLAGGWIVALSFTSAFIFRRLTSPARM